VDPRAIKLTTPCENWPRLAHRPLPVFFVCQSFLFVIPQGSAFAVALASEFAVVCSLLPTLTRCQPVFLFVIPQGSVFAVALAFEFAVVCSLLPTLTPCLLTEDVRAPANVGVEAPAVAVACFFSSGGAAFANLPPLPR
jgi:hypothetical protein